MISSLQRFNKTAFDLGQTFLGIFAAFVLANYIVFGFSPPSPTGMGPILWGVATLVAGLFFWLGLTCLGLWLLGRTGSSGEKHRPNSIGLGLLLSACFVRILYFFLQFDIPPFSQFTLSPIKPHTVLDLSNAAFVLWLIFSVVYAVADALSRRKAD